MHYIPYAPTTNHLRYKLTAELHLLNSKGVLTHDLYKQKLQDFENETGQRFEPMRQISENIKTPRHIETQLIVENENEEQHIEVGDKSVMEEFAESVAQEIETSEDRGNENNEDNIFDSLKSHTRTKSSIFADVNSFLENRNENNLQNFSLNLYTDQSKNSENQQKQFRFLNENMANNNIPADLSKIFANINISHSFNKKSQSQKNNSSFENVAPISDRQKKDRSQHFLFNMPASSSSTDFFDKNLKKPERYNFLRPKNVEDDFSIDFKSRSDSDDRKSVNDIFSIPSDFKLKSFSNTLQKDVPHGKFKNTDKDSHDTLMKFMHNSTSSDSSRNQKYRKIPTSTVVRDLQVMFKFCAGEIRDRGRVA